MAKNDFPKRDGFTSKFGIIAAAAGSAIGLGNIWKFPYIAGENGGGAFILLYLIFIVILGVPPLLSFGPWSHITLGDRIILDMYDCFVSNLSIPLVGLLTSILLGFVRKKEDAMDEATSGGTYQRTLYNIHGTC